MSNQGTPVWFNFFSAGATGCMAWCVVHPFNTASVRMNLAAASNPGAANLSFFPYIAKVVQEKRFMSLYDGLSAGILRQCVYATSRVGLFEVFRDELAKYRKIDFVSRLLVGCASGGVAAIISCPSEVTLVRLSNDANLPVESRRNYKGVVDAFVRILREEGWQAYFRGVAPFVNRAILVGAVQVGTYDQFRESYKSMGFTGHMNVMLASFSSGLLYSIVTNPFETAKNRMAFQKPDPVTGQLLYRSTMQTITTIAKTDGAIMLWAGFMPYFLRCGGHTICMFMACEWMRNCYLKMK